MSEASLPDEGEIDEALRAHVRRAFPGRELHEEAGTDQALDAVPGFKVLRLAPPSPKEAWAYVSLGMWRATPGEDGLELAILAPKEDRVHVETLSTCAYFHSFYGLELGKTMKVGRGWIPGSPCTRLLLAKPRFSQEFEYLQESGRRVRFLQLLPITPDEEKLAKESGQHELERRLEGADLLDPSREPVA